MSLNFGVDVSAAVAAINNSVSRSSFTVGSFYDG